LTKQDALVFYLMFVGGFEGCDDGIDQLSIIAPREDEAILEAFRLHKDTPQ
jgi:hypothetical protein